MSTIGKNIHNLRKEKQMSQAQLAEALSVATNTISMYEREQRVPDYDKISDLCKLFDVSSDYIIGVSKIKKPASITSFNDIEKAIIEAYRNLPAESKEVYENFLTESSSEDIKLALDISKLKPKDKCKMIEIIKIFSK